MRVYLAGMTCLCCGKDYYKGYAKRTGDLRRRGFTTPCLVCGDVQPASMSEQEFYAKIKLRDTQQVRETEDI